MRGSDRGRKRVGTRRMPKTASMPPGWAHVTPTSRVPEVRTRASPPSGWRCLAHTAPGRCAAQPGAAPAEHEAPPAHAHTPCCGHFGAVQLLFHIHFKAALDAQGTEFVCARAARDGNLLGRLGRNTTSALLRASSSKPCDSRLARSDFFASHARMKAECASCRKKRRQWLRRHLDHKERGSHKSVNAF